jgi:hypothetical protein
MTAFRKTVLAAGSLVLLAGGAAYADSGWLKGSTEEQLKTLAELQPGLGTVMMEYSFRFGTMYYAAQGGNWKLADYQEKEMTEIQEVGETTRPPRAKALKEFEEKYLGPIADAIKAKDIKKFNVAFQSGMKACNDCHTDQNYGFIRYQLPKSSPSPLSTKP